VDYFDYGAEPKLDSGFNPESFDIEEFLEQSQRREKTRLETEIERIDQELDERKQIHDQAIDELESKLDWYIERVKNLRKRGAQKSDREKLKSRIDTFYSEIREEKRSHWRDQQQLKEERRKLLKSIEETEDTDIMEFL
jgi:hypothetical protein